MNRLRKNPPRQFFRLANSSYSYTFRQNRQGERGRMFLVSSGSGCLELFLDNECWNFTPFICRSRDVHSWPWSPAIPSGLSAEAAGRRNSGNPIHPALCSLPRRFPLPVLRPIFFSALLVSAKPPDNEISCPKKMRKRKMAFFRKIFRFDEERRYFHCAESVENIYEEPA